MNTGKTELENKPIIEPEKARTPIRFELQTTYNCIALG